MAAAHLDTVKTKVNEVLEKYPVVDEPLQKLSLKAGGVDKAFLALGIILIPIFAIFAMGTGDFLIDLAGFLYPAYCSLKAIESKDKDDDTQWLIYWVIFALFKVVEGVADFLLAMIPFYFLIKLAFLVWCYHPSFLGATVVYGAVIKPFVIPKLGLNAPVTNEKKSE